MRVVKKTLKDFWESPNCARAEGPLRAWYTLVNSKETVWNNWTDLRRDYPSADSVGDCVVFNIGGNNYRLICRVRYPTFVFVLEVMTHREYDTVDWETDCACHNNAEMEKKTNKPTQKQGKRRPKPKRKK